MRIRNESQNTNKDGGFRRLLARRHSPVMVRANIKKVPVFAGILGCNRMLMINAVSLKAQLFPKIKYIKFGGRAVEAVLNSVIEITFCSQALVDGDPKIDS